MTKRALESANIMLGDSEAQTWISNQLHLCCCEIEALELRSGFSALPDGILADVLEFATGSVDHEFGTFTEGYIEDKADYHVHYDIETSSQAATTLSHVCRRFRDIIVSFSTFWRRISPSMKPAIVSASFERCTSGSIPFEVYLRSPISPTHIIDSFLRRAINNRHLWKRFAHDWTFNYYPRAKEMTANTHILHRKIHAPQLSQIIIGFPYAIQAADNREVLKMLPKMHYYSSWSTPNLRFMKTSQMIPVPFSGSNTLTTLSIYQCLSQGTCFDLTSLMSFLASCPVLTEFMLKVRDSDRVHESYRQQLPPEHRMETKSVERLTLMFEWGDSSTIGDLINAIRFPSVSVAIFLINAEFGT